MSAMSSLVLEIQERITNTLESKEQIAQSLGCPVEWVGTVEDAVFEDFFSAVSMKEDLPF